MVFKYNKIDGVAYAFTINRFSLDDHVQYCCILTIKRVQCSIHHETDERSKEAKKTQKWGKYSILMKYEIIHTSTTTAQ
jgi:hypothetical protein